MYFFEDKSCGKQVGEWVCPMAYSFEGVSSGVVIAANISLLFDEGFSTCMTKNREYRMVVNGCFTLDRAIQQFQVQVLQENRHLHNVRHRKLCVEQVVYERGVIFLNFGKLATKKETDDMLVCESIREIKHMQAKLEAARKVKSYIFKRQDAAFKQAMLIWDLQEMSGATKAMTTQQYSEEYARTFRFHTAWINKYNLIAKHIGYWLHHIDEEEKVVEEYNSMRGLSA